MTKNVCFLIAEKLEE